MTISLIPLTLQHFKLFKVVVTSQLVEVPYKVAFQFWTVKHRSSQIRLFVLLGFRQLSNFPHSCCNLNVIEFDCEIIFEWWNYGKIIFEWWNSNSIWIFWWKEVEFIIEFLCNFDDFLMIITLNVMHIACIFPLVI